MDTPDQQHIVLRVLTMDTPTNTAPCNGGYSCECADCRAAVEDRIRRGRRALHKDQPWQPRLRRAA